MEELLWYKEYEKGNVVAEDEKEATLLKKAPLKTVNYSHVVAERAAIKEVAS